MDVDEVKKRIRRAKVEDVDVPTQVQDCLPQGVTLVWKGLHEAW